MSRETDEALGTTNPEIDNAEHESSTDDDDDDELDRYWPPPSERTLKGRGSYATKCVSALAFNNAGTKFASGGHDFEVRIWDFQALDKDRPECSNNVQPSGQSVIKHLEFSPDDEQLLVISGSSQAVLLKKDGTSNKNQSLCAKGDQYIADMANTKGHVQMLNDGCWNPKDKSLFMTCSNDSTIRLWDVNNLSQQRTVIKIRSPAGGLKTVPNVCKFSRDALSITAGCYDGSILTWDTRRKFFSTSSCIKNAHLKGSEITGIDYNYGGNKICSRSEDESCKIWDLRQLKSPLATRTGLTTLHATTDCCFAPDDKHVMAGTSKTKDDPGRVHYLSSNDLTTSQSIDVDGASVLRVRWHAKINHVAYSCSDGHVMVGYDERRSMGGLLSAGSGRGVKRKKYVPGGVADIKRIITPHSLPLFKEDSSSTSFAKMRQDPKRSYKPQHPSLTNENGQVRPDGATLSSYIARNLALAAKKRGESGDKVDKTD